MLEIDFLGTAAGRQQPAVPGLRRRLLREHPTNRIRHFTPRDRDADRRHPGGAILVQLFGWQSAYQPNTVQIQGVPGELYSRTPQLRIQKTIKAHPVIFEAAVAATRPFQRDASLPGWSGGSALWHRRVDRDADGRLDRAAPRSLKRCRSRSTEYVRRVQVVDNYAAPSRPTTSDKTAGGVAVDAFIPVIPGDQNPRRATRCP